MEDEREDDEKITICSVCGNEREIYTIWGETEYCLDCFEEQYEEWQEESEEDEDE